MSYLETRLEAEIKELRDILTDEQAKVAARDLVIGDLCWVVAMMKDGLPYTDELVTARMQSLFAYHQDTE
jgi:hypothetical protein